MLYPEEMERFDELKDMYGNIQPNYMKEEFIHHHGIKVMDAIDLVMQGVFKRKPDRSNQSSKSVTTTSTV